jgi:hypothetical protein
MGRRKLTIEEKAQRKAERKAKKDAKKIVKVQQKDIPLDFLSCMTLTVKQIRQTKEYKSLTPLGKQNKSGTYHYGNKSSLRKEPLCRALSNPLNYQAGIKSLKTQGKNAAIRKRNSRTGDCLVKQRKAPCDTAAYPHLGFTTTADKCCYKKKQSEKTRNKRLKNAQKKENDKEENKVIRKRGRPKK